MAAAAPATPRAGAAGPIGRGRRRSRGRRTAAGRGHQQPLHPTRRSQSPPQHPDLDLPLPQPPAAAVEPGPHPAPPGIGAAQLHIGAGPRAQDAEHRAPLPGPRREPLPLPGGHRARDGHDDDVEAVEQRGRDGHQLRPGSRHQRQAIQPHPGLGGGDQPQIGTPDDAHPRPARGRLDEHGPQQRRGRRARRDGHRGAPPQPTRGQQPGQRRDDGQHAAIHLRRRSGPDRAILRPPQQPPRVLQLGRRIARTHDTPLPRQAPRGDGEIELPFEV